MLSFRLTMHALVSGAWRNPSNSANSVMISSFYLPGGPFAQAPPSRAPFFPLLHRLIILFPFPIEATFAEAGTRWQLSFDRYISSLGMDRLIWIYAGAFYFV